jgi:ferredoxin
MLTTNGEGRDESVRTESRTVRIRVSGVRPAEVRLPVGGLLLEGLLGGGVAFAYACQAGMCGECRCRLVSGRVEELPSSPGALLARDRAHGVILACRARVLSDLVIQAITGCEPADCSDASPLPVARLAPHAEVTGG